MDRANVANAVPVPYGAGIVHTENGERLMRATNAVGEEHDPSAHAEVRTIRLACHQLNSPSLRGYTLYTTCEPCPMCMACALWARLDRVVYGATIAAHLLPAPNQSLAKQNRKPLQSTENNHQRRRSIARFCRVFALQDGSHSTPPAFRINATGMRNGRNSIKANAPAHSNQLLFVHFAPSPQLQPSRKPRATR